MYTNALFFLYRKAVTEIFHRIDLDDNGFISRQELDLFQVLKLPIDVCVITWGYYFFLLLYILGIVLALSHKRVIIHQLHEILKYWKIATNIEILTTRGIKEKESGWRKRHEGGLNLV